MPKHHNGKVHGKQNKKMMRQKELTQDVAHFKRSSPTRKNKDIHNSSWGSPFSKYGWANWEEGGPHKEDWW